MINQKLKYMNLTIIYDLHYLQKILDVLISEKNSVPK